MVILAFPGFYVAEGTADKLIDKRFSSGFDVELYWLYFAFMPVISTALILGQMCGQRMYIRTIPRNKMDTIIKLLFFVVSIYCLMHLLCLPDIPFNNLFFSSSYKFAEIYLQRISITHGLGQEESLPFVFRYWRHIAQVILPTLFCYLFITSYIGKRGVWTILFLFCFVSYLQVFTIEKAPFLSFMLSIILLLYLRRQNESRGKSNRQFRIIIQYGAGLITTFACIVFANQLFMNVQDGILNSFLSRLMVQSSSDYLQIDYVRQNGFLGFSGFHMPILSSLLNIEHISLSKYAMSLMYPLEDMGEVMGTGGGMSLTNLYYIMGWFSVPALFMFVFAFGLVDKTIINSIYNPINKDAFYFNISFYATCISHYAICVGSSIWMVFAIPTILSASLMTAMAVYFIIIRVPWTVYIRKRLSHKLSIPASTVEKHN